MYASLQNLDGRCTQINEMNMLYTHTCFVPMSPAHVRGLGLNYLYWWESDNPKLS